MSFEIGHLFGKLRFQRREWWAMMLRSTEMASSQLDSSFAEYSPKSLAMAARSGNWFFKFLYRAWLLIVAHSCLYKKVTRQQIYEMPTGSIIVRFGLSYPRIFIFSAVNIMLFC